MSTKRPENYLEFWRQAEAQEFGLYITVEPNDQMQFICGLYECRKIFGGYEDMIVCQPAPEGTVFILHKTVEIPE